MADNAGLVGLLLEQHQLRPPPPAAAASRAPAQITSKATRPLLLATAKNDVVDVQKGASSAAASFSRSSSSSSSRAPAPTVSPTTTACPFLQRCFFCHGELADGRDIYMYRSVVFSARDGAGRTIYIAAGFACDYCWLLLSTYWQWRACRGERAFCSEECRCRHILAEEDDDDTTSVGVVAAAAAADCSTQLRHRALAASFTFWGGGRPSGRAGRPPIEDWYGGPACHRRLAVEEATMFITLSQIPCPNTPRDGCVTDSRLI